MAADQFVLCLVFNVSLEEFMNFQAGVKEEFLASGNLLNPFLKIGKILKGLIGFGPMLSNSIPAP